MATNTISATSHSASSARAPIYSSLTATRKEIRLLNLVSGNFQEDVRLELEVVSLDENPVFTALSYCWGDLHDQANIILNEQSFAISRNLANALRRWGSEQKNLTIWVDAICINQSDIVEKQSQVALMGQIYASAAHVRVWLGEQSDDSDIAMEFIDHIDTVDFERSTTVIDAAVMIAVKRLIRRDWWTRLWIVQEILLAKDLTVHCGTKETRLENFIRFQEEYSRLRWNALPHLQALRSHISGPLSLLLWSWDDYKAQIQQGGISLSQMITVTAQSQYSEPLDRIYALLGVCSEIERRCFPINYSISMRDLNILVTKFFLLSRRFQLPLYYLQFHQGGKDMSLPSWVSDFATADEENHIIAPTFRAGADNRAWATLGLPPGRPGMESYNSLDIVFEDAGTHETLVVPGLVLDEIIKAFPSPWIELYDGTDLDAETQSKTCRRNAIANAIVGWWKYIQTLPAQLDPYAASCGRYEAFWRTLITNHGIDVSKGPVTAEMDFDVKFAVWTGTEAEQSSIEDHFKPYSDAAVNRCIWRSFFVTQEGYFGLGPHSTPVTGRAETRASDLICILRGAHAPYVLRPRNDGCYDLIGEAYVHGVMDGNFVRAAEASDVRTFRIR